MDCTITQRPTQIIIVTHHPIMLMLSMSVLLGDPHNATINITTYPEMLSHTNLHNLTYPDSTCHDEPTKPAHITYRNLSTTPTALDGGNMPLRCSNSTIYTT